MIYLDRLRQWISRNLAPIIFLSAYFVTVVLGNIIYSLPFGKEQLQQYEYTAHILQFETLFSSGFWGLLFLPFVVTPAVVFIIRRTMTNQLRRFATVIPDFSKASYLFVTLLCYSFVLYSLIKADAFSLFIHGTDAVSSVEARFKIRGQMGFAPLVVLMSLLHYLSIYALVSWTLGKGKFWGAVTFANVALMSVSLTLLNMKWPILIFYAGLVLAIFVYAKKWPYLKTAVGAMLLIAVYFLISTFVFRLIPATPLDHRSDVQHANVEHAEGRVENGGVVENGIAVENGGDEGVAETIARREGTAGQKIRNVGEAVGQNAPMLLFNVVNRMAIIYPYYYQVFTTEGQVCGGVIAQARVGQACRPSTFIYSRIFNDQFNSRGTAPAAVHISGYALGGWPIAIFALLCASVILGLFASLPLDFSASVGSLSITGAIVGYHFSQVPGEGPIFYEHGVFWTIVMLFMYALFRVFYIRIRKSQGRMAI